MKTRSPRSVWIVGLTVLAVLLQPSLTTAADIKPAELLEKMRAAMWPGQDMKAKFEIQVTSNTGEHAFVSGSYYRKKKDGDVTLQRFAIESPPELNGFEVAGETKKGVPESLEVYVPAVRRVRHLELDMRKESFLGTDFNFEDLGFEDWSRAVNTSNGQVQLDGKTVHEIVSVPDKDWMYEKIVRYIDAETYLPIQTDYICWGVGRCKVRRIERVERIGAYDSPAVISMENLLSKETTRLTVKSAEFDVGLDDSLLRCHVRSESEQ